MQIISTILSRIYYFNEYKKFKRCGSNVRLSRGGILIRPKEVELGSNIYIGPRFYISAWELTVGNNVMIGPNLILESDNHIYDKVGQTMFDNRSSRNIKKITIKDDVWIGANVVILPGVTIGEGTVIGAGSVVTKDMPDYSICVGNPCRKIKSRFSDFELENHLNIIKFKNSK